MIGVFLSAFRPTSLKYQTQLFQQICAASNRFARQLIMGLLLISLGLGFAQAQAWNALNEEQRSVLAPLEEDWSSLNQNRQKKWVEVANLYPKMSEADRITLQSRMYEWSGLSSRQRQRARDNYLRTLKISPEKKAAAWENYQQLSDEDKKLLAEKRAASSKRTTVTSPALK
ncbi:DUF3106 domain-containing protein [Polynucleobacter sp. 30F-ANTBAC]|jgi:Protein of unknown function (DUF3106)|nr:DUF3106 domain-containing protein [Polynucleobacter sp. 30F-ANTBAC]